MDIGYYIADLLRTQDEVNLPGIGTFSKARIPGYFDSGQNMFMPPSFTLSFSESDSEQESLGEYISARKNLTPTSSEYFVKRFAASISELLASSGFAEIKPLGSIRQENESRTFQAAQGIDLGGGFYGLKPVAELKNQTIPLVREETIPVAPSGSIEDFINPGLEADSDNEVEEDSEVSAPKSRVLLYILGVVLAGIIAAILLYLFHPETRSAADKMLSKAFAATPDTTQVEVRKAVVTPIDTISKVTPTLVPDTATVDSATSVPVAEPETSPPGTPKIEIIGATFGKRAEAEAYVRTMQRKGIPAKIADDMPGPRFKVSIGSFQDYESAQVELNRIIRDLEKDAWIAKYKSKKPKK